MGVRLLQNLTWKKSKTKPETESFMKGHFAQFWRQFRDFFDRFGYNLQPGLKKYDPNVKLLPNCKGDIYEPSKGGWIVKKLNKLYWQTNLALK